MRLYRQFPGIASITEALYRYVANHRTAFSFLTRLLWGEHVEQPTHFLTRWLFLRLLGIVYLIAFVSLGVQIDGLLGRHGITPAAQFMEAVHNWSHAHTTWDAISLCADGLLVNDQRWLPAFSLLGWSSDFTVGNSRHRHRSLTGIALAILFVTLRRRRTVHGLSMGRSPLGNRPAGDFLRSRQLLPGLTRETPPSRLPLWLLRWLLFRLMFASGVVKLATGDKTWHSLTALTYHYETQPLPTWIGWYAHQLPLWFQKFSCGFLFVVELGVPFLIFAPRRLRFFACGALILLMTLIALTGNYCFFNLLTVTLCVLLLDDVALRRFAPTRWRNFSINPRCWRCPCWMTAPLAAAVLLVTMMTLGGAFREEIAWPSPMVSLFRDLSPLRSFNGYGLFAMMTTSRPEIIIEGSNDNQMWLPYEFKYKPGDPTRRPAFVAPHQPRLDWQMWFEALNVMRPRNEPSQWFMNFCVRLLQGQPEVLALLKTNPFPNAPPRYLRAMVYDYHFTDFATRRETGAWWRRELLGPYCPVMSLPVTSR